MGSTKLRTGLLCLSLVLLTFSAVEFWHVASKHSRTGQPGLGELSIAAAPVPGIEPVAVVEPFDAPGGNVPAPIVATGNGMEPTEQVMQQLRPAIDRAIARKKERPVRAPRPGADDSKKEGSDKAVVLAMTEDTAVIGIRGSDGEVTTRLVRVGDPLGQFGRVTAIKLGQGEVATSLASIRVEY